MDTLVKILIGILIIGLVFFLLSLIPLPYPFHLIAQIVVVLIAIVFLCNLAGWLPSKSA